MTRNSRAGRIVTTLLVAVAVLYGAAGLQGCSDGLRPVARDSTPPSIRVLSPVDTAYDLDGDKLLDLVVSWSDSASPIALSGVVVRSLTGVNGTADSDTNLLAVWRVERLDGAGLVVHETVQQLLHGGVNLLELVVADTAGNVRFDTIRVTLPFGALHKTITTGIPAGTVPALGLTFCAADSLVYMTAGRSIVVVDPNSLTVLAAAADPYAADNLKNPLCVPGDPVLYVTERVERFDRVSRAWTTPIDSSFASIGIAQSSLDPNLVYVGESNTGTIGVVDRAIGAVTKRLLPFSSQEFVADLEVLAGGAKLYATRFLEGGILVLDPRNDSVLTQIRVGGSAWPDPGRTDAIEMRKDGQRLYAAVIDGLVRGVVEIDTRSDTVIRNLPLSNYFAIDLGLSPSERRMFVTTQDNGSPSENALIDVENWTVLQMFARPRPTGASRFDGALAFNPFGKLIFVARDRAIDVYLNRE